MFKTQPIVALDSLCGGDAKAMALGIRILGDVGLRKHPLDAVSDVDLLNWCDRALAERYPALAQVITTVKHAGENAPPQWTNVALRFLERAPDPNAILREFISGFRPMSGWSGSLATILQSNSSLLDQLGAFPALLTTVNEQREHLRKWIEEEQRRETAFGRRTDERFE
jgi:hypothetical protein